MARAPLTRATKRDITKALNDVIGAQNTNDATERAAFLADARTLLTNLDARTGRKDPHLRPKRRPAKKPAKRSARKARR